MLKKVAITIGLLLAFACGLALLFRVGSGEFQFTRKFKSIELGSPVSDAVAKLGPPTEVTDQFHLGQRTGFEDAYRRAERSNSESFYIWSCCVDMTYTLGVDSNGTVVLAEYGGT
ncbi:MAG: hypothetical protein WD738_11520 [Pirellulales bacterium]